MSWRGWLGAGMAIGMAGTVLGAGLVPNDPYYAVSWHAEVLHLPQAWQYSRGSGDVVVAVLDTGVIAWEPDLEGRVLQGLSVLPVPSDETVYRHGTWVASAIAMGIDNGIGGVGVGQFSILPVQTVEGLVTTPEWIAEGIRQAADRGARVINVSLQALTYGQIDAAAGYALEKGALTFVAAGNRNARNPMGGLDNLIFVSGTDQADQRWVKNASVGSSWGPYVDIAAPAVDILVADPIDPNLEGYGIISGTSFAAPLAAGAAALAWSINPLLTPDEVRQMLYRTAVDLGDPGWDEVYGWGRIDIGALAAAAWATVPEPGTWWLLIAIGGIVFRRPARGHHG